MVEHSNKLDGWSRNVYEFGCAFIHLSNFHNQGEHFLFTQENNSEATKVKEYIKYYHNYEIDVPIRLTQIVELAPQIFDKVSSNLIDYLTALEKGYQGSDWTDWPELD